MPSLFLRSCKAQCEGMSEQNIFVRVQAIISGYLKGMQESADATDKLTSSTDAAAKSTDKLKDAQNRGEAAAQKTSDVLNDLGEAAQGSSDAVMSLAQRFIGAGGLISVVGTGALALGVLGVAAYKGTREVELLEEATIVAGDRIALSTGQMLAMADSIDAIAGTKSDAIEALTIIAESSGYTGAMVEKIGLSAVMMNNVTGKAIGETVSEFESLRRSPVSAVMELNTQYGFLTASVFEQIAALERQGRVEDAAVIAARAYADEMSSRAVRVEESLGLLTSAWNAVGDAASEAWDFMRDLGRPDTLEDKIAAQIKVVEKLSRVSWRSGSLANEQAYLDDLREQQRMQGRAASSVGDRQATEAAGVRAAADILDLRKQTATAEEKMNAELDKYRRNVEALRKANPSSELVQPDRVKADEAAIRKKFSTKTSRLRTSPKEDLNAGFDTTAAQSYAKTMDALAKIEADAAISSMDLNAAQSQLMTLMMSPEWSRMPEPWRLQAVAQFESANAAEVARAAQERLNSLIEQTPTAQLEKAQADMMFLADAFDRGQISADQFSEAATERLGLVSDAADENKRAFEDLQRAIEGWGRDSADAIVDFAATGKASFGDLVDSMIRDLARMMVYQNVTQPLVKSLGGVSWGSLIGGLFSGGSAAPSPANISRVGLAGGRASGGSVSAGGLYEVNETGAPEVLVSNGRTFLMMGAQGGSVVPAGGGGAAGGSAPRVNVSVVNQGGQQMEAQASASSGQDGSLNIEVMLYERVKGRLLRETQQGGGMAPLLETKYGLNPAAGARR